MNNEQFIVTAPEEVTESIRKAAFRCDKAPASYLRNLLGLEEKSIRSKPRLSISLSQEERETLARENNIDPNDKNGIIKTIRAKLHKHHMELKAQEIN